MTEVVKVPAGSSSKSGDAPSSLHAESNGGVSVLVVDDDPDLRCLLRLLFELEDFQVAEATSGPEAVALALKQDPEFIVLDYMMPGMTGEKTAPVLRGVVPGARIVALSALLDEKPAWADAFLSKDRIVEILPLLNELARSRDRLASGDR